MPNYKDFDLDVQNDRDYNKIGAERKIVTTDPYWGTNRQSNCYGSCTWVNTACAL